MPTLDEQMEDLYGPMPAHSDYKRNEHIMYTQGGETYSGTIIWVCGPGNVAGRHLPTHYIVERDGLGDSFPDTVWQADIVGGHGRGHNEEPAMVKCPYCGGLHYAHLVEACPNNPQRQR